MPPLRPRLSRLRCFFRQSAIERDMAAKMRAHLELQEEANRA